VIRPRVLLGVGLIVASCLINPQALPGLRGAESLPERLSDQEFWKLVTASSETDGYFRSDNLLSNELAYPYILPDLVKTAPLSRIYVGVGPEQNFHYIAALRPKMAFIVDIRRRNLDLHLMYKALFELSRDRVEFVSKLFSRSRPAGLTSASTPDEIFAAFNAEQRSEEMYERNLKAIQNRLIETHGFALSEDDRDHIRFVYGSFYTFGPHIRYSSTQGGGAGFGGFNQPTYAELMMSADGDDHPGSYLATEESFRVVKELESKNLLVPVVGNFGGPKAIRAVGQFLKDHGAVVSAFYLSNVEMYLMQQSLWEAFCRNVASLPLDAGSTFIRSARGSGGYGGTGLTLTLASISGDVKSCQ
jgi:hypothetical protein